MRLVESIAGTFSVQDGPPVSSIQREFIKGYRQLFGFGTILARSPLEGHGQHFSKKILFQLEKKIKNVCHL